MMARILVADDSAGVRSAVRRSLSRGGHEVWDVTDGAQALELMATMEFDLLLTDVYMAGVDGMELLLRARQRGFSAPVIVMSGGGFTPREELLALASACGAFATLAKPFSPNDLRTAVSGALRTPAAD